MKHDPTFWILARATGLVAYGLLSATIVAGLVLKGRPIRSLRPASVMDLHRFLSLLALLAVGLHGVTLFLDETIKIPIIGFFVPGFVPYRSVWTSIGVLTAELMLIIHLSFRWRKKIGVRVWRRLHYSTYAAFAGATLHGLLAGTDSSRSWMLGAYAVVLGLVLVLTGWRATMEKAGARARAAAPQPHASASNGPVR